MSTSQTVNGNQHYLPASSDAEFGGMLASLAAALAYKQTALLVFSVSSGLAASTDAYLSPGYTTASADEISLPTPFAGKVAGVYVRSRTAPVGGSVAIAVGWLADGVFGERATATLAVGATTASAAANINPVEVGGYLYVKATPAGGYLSGAADLTVSIALVAA